MPGGTYNALNLYIVTFELVMVWKYPYDFCSFASLWDTADDEADTLETDIIPITNGKKKY